MSEYYLTDIHFHTNLSYDAYENDDGLKFNLNDFCVTDAKSDNPIKLICKTDHNIFNYEKYLEFKTILNRADIVLLPGIEINGDNKIHWLFIMNDLCLNKKSKGQFVGNILDEKIKDYFSYKELFPQIGELKNEQSKEHKIDEFISILNNNNISFIAIPHLDKESGFYKKIKKDNELLDLVTIYLNESIINGFESKKYDDFFRNNIESTKNNINELEKKISNGLVEIEEIERRKKHLDMLNIFSKQIERNCVSNIYGSDFHGKKGETFETYQKLKEKMFFLKADRTFEGLRLALLDQDSRIYTSEKYYKSKKEESSWIKELDLTINGKKEKIELGDALNTIIGSRGSGKSFLTNMIIGGDGYENANISEQIKLNNIIFADGSKTKTLDKNKYDYLGQRNSKNNSPNSIYQVLSEAPYNVDLFVDFIKRNNNAVTTEEKNGITEFVNLINNQIRNFFKMYELINDEYDISFFKEYDDYMVSKTSESSILSLLGTANKKYSLEIEKKLETEKFSKETLNILNDVISRVKKIEECFEYSKIEDDKKELVNEWLIKTEEINKIINNICESAKENKNDIKNVYTHSISMQEMLRKNMSNIELSFEQKFDIFETKIRLMKDILLDMNKQKENISASLCNKIENIENIRFNINSSNCKLEIVHILNLKKVTEELNDSMLKNYKRKINIDDFLHNLQCFEEIKAIKEIVENKSGRTNDTYVMMPENKMLEKSIRISTSINKGFNDISKMSPGERSSLLLDLILNSEKSTILIIDQPEDDLDNETIYKTIVSKIRELKNRRQLIVITHNANICLNGDSDRIVVCENNDGKFNYFSDSMESTNKHKYNLCDVNEKNERVLEIAANILDGGKEALRKRIKIIGQKDILFKED